MGIFLKVERLRALQRHLKLTDTAMAKKIGISRPQLWRAKGGSPVGEKFIAGFKSAFPRLDIEEFFEVQQSKRQ